VNVHKFFADLQARAKTFAIEHRKQPSWVPPFVEWAHGKGDHLDFGGAWVPPRVVDLVRAAHPDAAAKQDEINEAVQAEESSQDEPEESSEDKPEA